MFNLSLYEEALKFLDKALKIYADNKDILFKKALSLHHLKRYQEAIEYFNKTLRIEENFKSALYNKGEHYSNLLSTS